MLMNRLIAILVLAWCCVSSLFSQGMIDSTGYRLREQLRLFPQEKVCLHVDRTVLMAGDTIRLKAYVADAATLRPQIDDQFVYVELLNDKNRLLQRKRLIASNNLYTGYIHLPPDQEAGVYHLWAYTLYSSQVKGYDCLIPIQVGNNKPAADKKKTVVPVMRFFPEGGSIVVGKTCMVAFEATTSEGDSLDIEGDVVDSDEQVVTRFKSFHRGLGFFPIVAEAGQRYTAVCRDRSGKRYRFPLPEPSRAAACLHCRMKSGEVEVSINKGDGVGQTPLFLLVHCRGQMVSLRPVKADGIYHIPMKTLPAGVNSLMLLDRECHVLSERLVFSNNAAWRLPLTITTPSDEYGFRKKIDMSLALPGMKTDELAFLSLSVTDDGITGRRHSPSLWSQLLLSSDLQGINGSTDEYFSPTYQADRLDLLMMTCGWRRYDISAVLQGNYTKPTVEKEREQSISGRVRGVFANKPVDGAEVALMLREAKDEPVGPDSVRQKPPLPVLQTTTDSLGHFEFHGLNYPEDVDAFVYALRQKNRRCIVEIDKTYAPYTPDITQTRGSAKMQPWVDIDGGLLQQYERDAHLLDEVVVKGRRKYTRYSIDNTTWSLDRKQIEEGKYHDLGFLLLCSNILNVNYSNGTITADDMYSTGIDRLFKNRANKADIGRGSNVHLYVDGMYIPDLGFDDIDIADIDRVDLYLGSKALVFGDSVGVGIVNITTRNGLNRNGDSMFNNKIMKLVGYQTPIEYYFPQYKPNAKPSAMQPDVRRTIYWNPYLRMVKDTPMRLSFYSADLPTTYTVRVEGLTTRGRIVDGQLRVHVAE